MSFAALTNRGEYLPAHYLEFVLPETLKKKDGILARWRSEEDTRVTPGAGLRALRGTYQGYKTELIDLEDPGKRREKLHELHAKVLAALGYQPLKREIVVSRAAGDYQVMAAYADDRVVAVECEWATDTDAATDPEAAGRLLTPVVLDPRERVESGIKLATQLFATEKPPRYVLILGGGVLTLADRRTWSEGRYLSASLDLAFQRRDETLAGELNTIAALFGADSLYPSESGDDDLLTELLADGRQHSVGVSTELREGLRISVELIANEVLDRLREKNIRPEQVMEPRELGRALTREALRYLYRILFLLYAEARPELGVLPVDHPEYIEGYSLARLGDLVVRNMVGQSAREGFHLYESLDLLFRMVNDGHRNRGSSAVDPLDSESEGIRFEPLRSELFLPEAITLIGRSAIPHPDYDPDDPDCPRFDTRLRNETLRSVLRLLMLTKGSRKQRGGFISYAKLGINQLGAVYEGLMSYTGFIATEELYEVAKGGDPDKGSWMIPESTVEEYPDEVFVREKDDNGRRTGPRVRYRQGAFVYRLAGRERQTSASYYTPQSLTEVTVQLALQYRLDQNGTTTPARELLDWTICEPALGSGAFLNEAIDQVAAEYLRRRAAERGMDPDPESYLTEKQKVKAYIALHNCYGVDLNRTAVELAEVSLWLNVMHSGLQAPWFGLHLRRGNSLIGAGRRYYSRDLLAKTQWLKAAPVDHPLRDGDLPAGAIHHFLLPADGWGAVAGEKEAKALAPDAAKALADWRRGIKKTPTGKGKSSQSQRLAALAGRVEYLWGLVQERLKISEKEIRRHIDVWGAEDLPPVTEAVPREKILADLQAHGTPYWRLKTLMDTWCALWFWPLDKVDLLNGTADEYADSRTVTHFEPRPVFEDDWDNEPPVALFELGDVGQPEQIKLPTVTRRQVGTRQARVTEQLRRKVPLATLDNWLDFAEALIGRSDLSDAPLYEGFAELAELEVFEDDLPKLMIMDQPHRLAERFPWLDTVIDIAEEQGFFHWELTFAQVFARGGFDLQIGNPPWVRPRWEEDAVLAEHRPWFKLSDKPSTDQWNSAKRALLSSPRSRDYYLDELASNAGVVASLGSVATYPLLAGTQPDLYRAFMNRCWSNLGAGGTAGLMHPDSHFTGVREGPLRAAAYRHLRVHGSFVNAGNWAFGDLARNLDFGIHIYANLRQIEFLHLSQLYSAHVLSASLTHDGTGEPPGQKINGGWNKRAHKSRVVSVDEDRLAKWRKLGGNEGLPLEQTALLYPITTYEDGAIAALASARQRLAALEPQISSGYHEKGAKEAGLIRFAPGRPTSVDETVLQGSHFGIATPFAKQPNDPFSNSKDWVSWDLRKLQKEAVPRVTYVRVCDRGRYVAAQDRWVDHKWLNERLQDEAEVVAAREAVAVRMGIQAEAVPYSAVEEYLAEKSRRPYADFYRVVWREMIDPKASERSLFAAIVPPGPAHIHAVRTMALSSAELTVLTAGFFAGLPLDYMLRISGAQHLDVASAVKLPAPEAGHPLASDLLLRTLRLNCLTAAYSPLWAELFEDAWAAEDWVVEWPRLEPLSLAKPEWDMDTPLRTEYARRAALVEIDALVSAWLGISADELIAVYRARYPILADREAQMWFDAGGRRIAADSYAFGYGQTKEDYLQLVEHLKDPGNTPPPDGYTAPFYKADRESEMRRAHSVFSGRMSEAERGEA